MTEPNDQTIEIAGEDGGGQYLDIYTQVGPNGGLEETGIAPDDTQHLDPFGNAPGGSEQSNPY